MTDPRRSNAVERLLSVQRAAHALGDSAAVWWRDLAEAAVTAVTVESLDGFYRLLLAAMQPVLDADEISILVADHAEEALITRTSLGLGEDTTVTLRIPVGEGMAGRVLASKAPLVVDDLSTIKLVSSTLQDQGLRSVVAVPIVSEGRILGVMHAGSTEVAHFSQDDAELLEILADRVAMASEHVFASSKSNAVSPGYLVSWRRPRVSCLGRRTSLRPWTNWRRQPCQLWAIYVSSIWSLKMVRLTE